MTSLIFVMAGLLSGAIFAAQGAINGRLAAFAGGPLVAALISFSVGWLSLAALILLSRPQAPNSSVIATAPPWVYLGGLIGATGVALAALSMPRIGIATWVGALIAGQLMASIWLDHLGAFGQEVREITPGRIAGMICLALGVWLIRRY